MRTVICAALAATVIIWAGGWMYSAANSDQAAKAPRNAAGNYFMRCSNAVKVGIKDPATGWNAEPDQNQSFIEATIVKQGGIAFINCDYGTGALSATRYHMLLMPGTTAG